MELNPIYQRLTGVDVHHAKTSACALAQQPASSVLVEQREFGGFKRERRALAQWAREFGAELLVMENTGMYWKSPYAAIESVGIASWVPDPSQTVRLSTKTWPMSGGYPEAAQSCF